MGTQSAIGYTELGFFTKPSILCHKVPLITPSMEIDITGQSLKNSRTHLIDHPKDEGLKQREQLWTFQQKYRGAPVAKLKPVLNTPYKGTVGSTSNKTNSPFELDFTEGSSKEPQRIQRTLSSDGLCLQSRFQGRFSHRLRVTMKPNGGDSYTLYDTFTTNNNVLNRESGENDEKRFAKTGPDIARHHSSGLIARDSLCNKLPATDRVSNRKRVTVDESRFLRKAIERYGSLDRLPDIGFSSPDNDYEQSQLLGKSLRAMNPYVQFGRRLGIKPADRRVAPLRRSLTNIDTARRKHSDGSRRDESARLSCIDSDEEEGVVDDEEEYAKETQIVRTQKLHERESKQAGTKVQITSSLNTQDDLALLNPHALARQARQHSNGLNDAVVCSENTTRKDMTTSERLAQDAIVSSDAVCYLYSSDDSDLSDSKCSDNAERTHHKPNNNKPSRKPKRGKCEQQGSDSGDSGERPSSDDSLDIPEDRFGSTTHSIDRKLAIRRPWDWRPSLYRWTDKTLKETDKPYIEKVINSGELVDEYNYDSFARTKPLKLQNYPDQCQPFKDRNGVLR